MRYRNLVLAAGLAVAALASAGCESVSTDYIREHEPAHMTGDGRIIVEERAAERLGLRTDVVREAHAPASLVIPEGALYYDPNGKTWVYVQEEPLTFVREPIRVKRIEDDLVFLSDGPAAGTHVVTVGVPELVGVETGVGH